ncbi:MAG: hypothetical protein EXX96DRAFT_508253 [Benjaminiella poitrasii]|nr:MAG: hypothetical protein EXX96DRAFT_508253 [Benjaminiella poitrasii]
MLCSRQLRLIWIFTFILCFLFNIVQAKKKKKHHHHHDDDKDNDYDNDDDDENDDNDNEEVDTPEFITPKNSAWLEGLDLSNIEGRVRPIGSGICKNAKCDGTDNEKCFETCGNQATPDDIYGCPMEKTWALTFDDGPSNFTTNLLDILDKTNVKVTFCVMGAHAEQYPDIIQRAYRAGHQIASHTYSHPHLMSLSNEEIVYEVRATEEAIKAAIGVKPRYIRPPYGEADARVKSILKMMGYKTLMWNVDPTDYDVHQLKDGPQRIQQVFEKISSGGSSSLNAHNDPGFISLQHDLYKVSIDQVSTVIQSLQGKGFKFTTAAECIGDKDPHSSATASNIPTIVNASNSTISENELGPQSSDNSIRQAAIGSSSTFTTNSNTNKNRQENKQLISGTTSLTVSLTAIALGCFGLTGLLL